MTKGKKVESKVEAEENGPELEETEEVSEPEDELAAVCKERDEYFDLLTRKQAEFENYRRRVEKEKADIRVRAQSEVIRELLSVIDACETGLESLTEAGTDDSSGVFVEGYELLFKQLVALLERFEVTEIPGVGAIFDPNVHEAVVREVSPDHQEGEILDQFRKGYLIKDQLLRPSQVRVAVQPEK